MTCEPTRRPVTAPMPPWGVVIFESHHAQGFRMGVSRHDWLEVFYVLEGGGAFEIEGRSVACAAGDIVVVPVAHAHRIRDDADHPLAMYGLRIRPDVWRNAAGIERRLPEGRVHRNKLASLGVRAEFRQLLFEQRLERSGHEAMMIGRTLYLLATLARVRTDPARPRPQPDDPHPTGLREKVEAYIAELEHRFLQPTDIDRVAYELGMSRRRFTELFRELTGTTWSRRVRRLRIDHAKELLRGSSKSVLSVAFESGFEDLSSFYRAFDRETGLSPHRWRERRARS